MRFWLGVLIVGVALPAPTWSAPPAAADTAQTLTAANGVTATCMARTTTKHDGHEWEFVVPVPAAKQADFTAKGFQPAACGKLIGQLAVHKRFVCEIAEGNDAVQKQTEAQLGIDARKLCAAVKLLIPDTDAVSGALSN